VQLSLSCSCQAVAFLVVIPAGELLLLLSAAPLKTISNRIAPFSVKPQNTVKPLNRKTPRQSSEIAWRMSYLQPSILNTASEVKEQRDPPRLFRFASRRHLLENKYFARNPFRLNILQTPPACKPLK
jgi:hypothetical protein